jgi:hypothetical protein
MNTSATGRLLPCSVDSEHVLGFSTQTSTTRLSLSCDQRRLPCPQQAMSSNKGVLILGEDLEVITFDQEFVLERRWTIHQFDNYVANRHSY